METQALGHDSTASASGKPGFWVRIGGGSLIVAISVHALILAIGAFWILQIIHVPEKKVDFMPSGSGGAPRGVDVEVQQKRQTMITPVKDVKRVFALNTTSDFVLPEIGADFGQMNPLASISSGGMSGGLGGNGMGKGFGSANGVGNGLGTGMPKGIKLFGMDLNVRSIGVVLDISRSMTPHLKRVVDEVNRVAEESPVIMQFGCGLSAKLKDDREVLILPVTAPDDGFKKFWYWYQSDKYRGAPPSERNNVEVSGPVPSPRVFSVFDKRPNTYFHEKANTTTTADAILSRPLSGVAAIYWFADFEDEIQPEAAEQLLKSLKSRNQKLYIQASKSGKHLSAARDLIAIPSGGGEIKPMEEP